MTEQEIFDAIGQAHKVCTNCEKIKPIDDYHKNGNRRRGRCKECRSDVRRKQRLEKIEMQKELFEDLKPNPVEEKMRRQEEVRQAIKLAYEDEIDEVVEEDKKGNVIFTALIILMIMTIIGLMIKGVLK